MWRGVSLLLASDVRFATPAARIENAAYIRVGVGGCDMGSGYLLPRLIGLSVASELLLTGRFLGAERAKAVGLVSDVVDDNCWKPASPSPPKWPAPGRWVCRA